MNKIEQSELQALLIRVLILLTRFLSSKNMCSSNMTVESELVVTSSLLVEYCFYPSTSISTIRFTVLHANRKVTVNPQMYLKHNEGEEYLPIFCALRNKLFAFLEQHMDHMVTMRELSNLFVSSSLFLLGVYGWCRIYRFLFFGHREVVSESKQILFIYLFYYQSRFTTI